MVIEAHGVAKAFRGRQVLRELELVVPERAIFGFIGANAAGKTTTIRILATLLRPDGGRAEIFGEPVGKGAREIRRRMGYMPEQYGFPPNVTVAECLEFYAAAQGVSRRRLRGVVDDVLELTDLTPRHSDLVSTLSRGLTQRVALARALLHDPDLLLLDEPAAGLDPRARYELRALLLELNRMGKTILISSHILPELSDFCTMVGFLDRGRLVACGAIDEVRQKWHVHRRYRIKFLGSPAAARARLLQAPFVERVGGAGQVLEFDYTGTEQAFGSLLAQIAGEGLLFTQVEEVSAMLDHLFFQLTAEGGEA